jgi:4-cresol dehydrogenase (hydroxylating)
MPKNVKADQWSAALSAFRSAIGEQFVFTSDKDLALYRDPYSPSWGEADERLISAALAPKNVEEVQAIVRVANRFGIPLYPISTGKNLGYGGPAPNLSGSVVVDLKRMNKIIEVDDRRHFAIVEPGVSYFDLHRHIRSHKLKVWIDCPDPGWGSVMGNALDHGVGWTWGPYKDHFGAHCGLEVVLPNGELLRTGMGAMPNAKTFADFRYGYGPYVDGLFSQAGFGIVTKMGIHLMPEQEAFLRKVVTVPRRQDIIPLVEITNALESSGIIGTPIFDSPLLYQQGDPALRQIASSPDVWNGNAADRYAVEKGVPSWQVGLNFYGPAEVNEAKWRHAWAQITRAIAGARFEDKESLRFPLSPEAEHAVIYKGEVGIPNLGVFALGARSPFHPGDPTDGHLFFSPIIPRTGEEFLKAQRIFSEGMRSSGVDHNVALGPFAFGPFSVPFTFTRSFVLVGVIPVSRSDPKINKRSRDAMRHLIALGAKHGYGEYRTAPLFQEQVMDTYAFNDNALRRFCETLKDAVDPKGIISPGRGGFWPRSMRKAAK